MSTSSALAFLFLYVLAVAGVVLFLRWLVNHFDL